MLERLTDLPAGVEGTRARGEVTAQVDPWIEPHGELRGVVVHAREFPGWENLGSFIRPLRFVRNHHRRIRRVALCAGGALATVAPKLAEHFVDAELRHFADDDLNHAIAWASEDAGARLTTPRDRRPRDASWTILDTER